MTKRRILGLGIAAVVAIAGTVLVAARTSLPPSAKTRAQWTAELARLGATQDSLRSRADDLIAADPRVRAVPRGDVVVSVPTAFLREVITRTFTDVADSATIQLSGIHVHTAKKVKKIVTLGEFTVDVDIHRIVGRLKPQPPDIRFGTNVVALSLPIEVKSGHGDATIRFKWDGKNVADLACGDMDVTQRVGGNVIPTRYVVAGRLELGVDGKDVVFRPVFPETKLNIRVKANKASWAAIDSILASKHGVCGFVLDKVNVPNILVGVTEKKGFNVKLPLHDIKPFSLPGAISDTLQVGPRRVAIATTLRTARIDSAAVWYAADVKMEDEPK